MGLGQSGGESPLVTISMECEISAINKMNTWKMVPRPNGITVVDPVGV